MEFPGREEIKRSLLMVPCESKQALSDWLRVFIGVHLPDSIVDESSNCSPMEFLWTAYSKMMAGDEEFQSALFYAARSTGKTLIVSILELLGVLHLKRDCGLMSSTEGQSLVAQRYLKNYIANPLIFPLVSKNSDRRIEFTYYQTPAGIAISQGEHEELPPKEREQCVRYSNFIQIVIATTRGANSLHVPLLLLDELDLADPVAYSESKMIPSPTRDGKPAVTLLTSSRKFAIGLVQQEIDKAEKTGLHIYHWNVIDVTRSCPDTRHLPNDPHIKLYVDQPQLNTLSEADWRLLDSESQKKYEECDAYAGCKKNCKMFAACRGRLATHQHSTTPFLVPIPHTQQRFLETTSPGVALAQLLCHKPSSAGLIYPNFDRALHVKTAAQMAEMVLGEPPPGDQFGKAELLALFKEHGLEAFAGLDHGFSHNYAVVTGFKFGARVFVVDVISAPELELSQKITVTQDRFKALGVDPTIWADPEDPSANKTLRRTFNLRHWTKGAGSVIGGIESVRSKLMPVLGRDPDLYFLHGDVGCELISEDMLKYHWKLDSAGNPTDIPDDNDDDRLDALRYMIMNLFSGGGRVIAGVQTKDVGIVTPPVKKSWIQEEVQGLVDSSDAPIQRKIKKGGLIMTV